MSDPIGGHFTNRMRLQAYLDNELDATGALLAEAHLAACPACRAEFAALKALKQRLGADDMIVAAPPGLAFKMKAVLKSQSQSQPQPQSQSVRIDPLEWLRRWSLLVLTPPLAVAAAVLLFLRPAPMPVEDELVSSHIRSMMAQHLVDVVSSDHHTVKPWFDGKLDFAPPVIASTGTCALIGGRLDYIDHRQAAAMAYACGKHVVNLYVQPSDQGDQTAALHDDRGYHVVAWRQAHMAYYAVSDMNAEQLRSFADTIAAHAQGS